MIILPAIDLYEKKAVRLLKGDYAKMTVYSDYPVEVAKYFSVCGAEHIHIVDLEGARDGKCANYETICEIIKKSGLEAEVGGGIRSSKAVNKYIDAGASRIILGTAAVTDPGFLREMVETHGDKIAVGADIKDGMVAIKGWTQKSNCGCFEFCEMLQKIGVKTVICTDISKDGAMKGMNGRLYSELSRRFSMNIIASGGVTSVSDVTALRDTNIYGAILGRAVYTGGIDLAKAIEVCK